MALVRCAIIALALTVLAAGVLALDSRLFAAMRHAAPRLTMHLIQTHFHAVILLPLYAGVFVAEWLFVGWRDSSLRRLLSGSDRSARSDIAVHLTSGLQVVTYFRLVTTGGLAALAGVQGAHLARAAGITSLGIAQLPVVAQLVILYLTMTFLDYCGHRLSHTRWIWPLHRFHHAATEFCVFTASRSHPTDIVGVLLSSLPMMLLAPTPDVALEFALGFAFLRHFIHSRIPLSFGIFGRWVFQTPTQHRGHHALETGPLPVGNFSLCPLWDRLFGTWRPVENGDFAIGVSDREYRHGFWYLPDLWRDYCDFLVGLRDGARALERKFKTRRRTRRGAVFAAES